MIPGGLTSEWGVRVKSWRGCTLEGGVFRGTPIPNLGKGNGAGNCNLFHDSTMSFYFHRYYRYYYVLLSVSNVFPLGV